MGITVINTGDGGGERPRFNWSEEWKKRMDKERGLSLGSKIADDFLLYYDDRKDRDLYRCFSERWKRVTKDQIRGENPIIAGLGHLKAPEGSRVRCYVFFRYMSSEGRKIKVPLRFFVVRHESISFGVYEAVPAKYSIVYMNGDVYRHALGWLCLSTEVNWRK